MSKLWQIDPALNKMIETFTIGQDQSLDLILTPHDILGSIAHTEMLAQIGILNSLEKTQLKNGLATLYHQSKEGSFKIEDGIEDVHSQVEVLLTQSLGSVGKKLHTGRSRNDQVLVDLRLYFRAEIESIVQKINQLFEVLIASSEEHKDQLMPGYTHLQIGMVSSFGLWFGAYAENLVDDVKLLKGVFDIINQNPLGSAAGYGSSFPLNRKLTTQLLGFDDLNYNSIHAQLGRGKTELQLAFGMAGLAHTLVKFSMDVCLFTNQNYSFITLPEELTTGSSIMPHKRNPDVFELIRGRCNQLLNLPQQIITLTTNLPTGYHRDFQLLKEVLFPAIENLKIVLDILHFSIPRIQVKRDLLSDSKYDNLYTVESINQAVKEGVPFRDAYIQVAQAVKSGSFVRPEQLSYTHEGSIQNLCTQEIREKMQTTVKAFPFEYIQSKLNQLIAS